MGKKAEDDWPLATKSQLSWTFLQCCFTVNRKVEIKFRQSVYPEFRRLPRDEGFALRLSMCVMEHFDSPEGDYPEKDFVEALLSWADEFNIKFECIIVPSIIALTSLEVSVFQLMQFQEVSLRDASAEDIESEFVFIEQGWIPTHEQESNARTRIEGSFRAYLDMYFENRRQFFEHHDVKAPKKQRASKLGTPDDRIESLAEYLINGDHHKDIAESISEETGRIPGDNDVGKMIRRTADILGISLPDRRGKRKNCTK